MSAGKCKIKQQWDATTRLLECLKSRTLKAPNAHADVEQKEFSFIAGGNAKLYSHFGRQFDSFSQNWTHFTIWQHLCSFQPKGLENLCPYKNLTWVLIASLFINGKSWKQPRCSSVGEWINKLWYIQAMEYYSVLKRNELLSYEKIWRDLKSILLSERSQRLYTVWF